MNRFTLDDDKARDWIAAGIEMTDCRAVHDEMLPAIGSAFGISADSGSEVWELVSRALVAGVITDAAAAPGDLALYFDFVPYDGETTGYHWALSMDGTGGLTARSAFSEMGYLGQGTGDRLRGAELALAVLREAAEAGNQIARGLAAYVAQEADR